MYENILIHPKMYKTFNFKHSLLYLQPELLLISSQEQHITEHYCRRSINYTPQPKDGNLNSGTVRLHWMWPTHGSKVMHP